MTTWEIIDSIGILALDNPPQNRLNEAAFVETGSFKKWISSDGLKGIIVAGKGRHFSSGADLEILNSMAGDENMLAGEMHKGKEVLAGLETLPLPTIAAIEGGCFGGGLEIALSCHVRVCARNALLAFPEVNHELMPGMGGTVRLPKLVGFGKAMETILSGDIINAERALEAGLVDHVVPPHEALKFSMDLMKKMVADRPIEVIRSVMRSLINSRTMPVNEAMEEETRMFCRLAVKKHG